MAKTNRPKSCGFLIYRNDPARSFLLMRHTDRWDLPKGHVDSDETNLECAYRELEEETSIPAKFVTIEGESAGLIRYDIPHALVPNIWKGRYRGQEQKWYLMRFHGVDSQVDLETEHPEFSSWKWMDSNDLVGSIVPFKRAVYEQVLAEFESKL